MLVTKGGSESNPSDGADGLLQICWIFQSIFWSLCSTSTSPLVYASKHEGDHRPGVESCPDQGLEDRCLLGSWVWSTANRWVWFTGCSADRGWIAVWTTAISCCTCWKSRLNCSMITIVGCCTGTETSAIAEGAGAKWFILFCTCRELEVLVRQEEVLRGAIFLNFWLVCFFL